MDASHLLASKFANTIKAEDQKNMRLGVKENRFRITFPLDGRTDEDKKAVFLFTCDSDKVTSMSVNLNEVSYAESKDMGVTFENWKDLITIVYMVYLSNSSDDCDKQYTKKFVNDNPVNNLKLVFKDEDSISSKRLQSMLEDSLLQKRSTSFNTSNESIESVVSHSRFKQETERDVNVKNNESYGNNGYSNISQGHLDGYKSVEIPDGLIFELRTSYPQYGSLSDKDFITIMLGGLVKPRALFSENSGDVSQHERRENETQYGSMRPINTDFRVRD